MGPSAALSEMKMKKASMTVAEMNAHVQALAIAFKIVLVMNDEVPREIAGAIPDLGRLLEEPMLNGVRGVLARIIDDETGYAVVLHELGHLIAPLGLLRPALPPHPTQEETRRYTNLMWDEECAAWDWAEHHSLIWSAAMETVRRIGLDSYVRAFKL